LDGARMVRVIGAWPGATLVPPVSVKLDLEVPVAATPSPTPKSPPMRASGGRGRAAEPQVSWWTARATTGEVKPGFTKDEVLRKPDIDPRAEGGMFSRLTSLLDALDER